MKFLTVLISLLAIQTIARAATSIETTECSPFGFTNGETMTQFEVKNWEGSGDDTTSYQVSMTVTKASGGGTAEFPFPATVTTSVIGKAVNAPLPQPFGPLHLQITIDGKSGSIWFDDGIASIQLRANQSLTLQKGTLQMKDQAPTELLCIIKK